MWLKFNRRYPGWLSGSGKNGSPGMNATSLASAAFSKVRVSCGCLSFNQKNSPPCGTFQSARSEKCVSSAA
ncbi:hypothetical protein D3C86_1898870 [compost metagenome]